MMMRSAGETRQEDGGDRCSPRIGGEGSEGDTRGTEGGFGGVT